MTNIVVHGSRKRAERIAYKGITERNFSASACYRGHYIDQRDADTCTIILREECGGDSWGEQDGKVHKQKRRKKRERRMNGHAEK